jgi:hypothetical protein
MNTVLTEPGHTVYNKEYKEEGKAIPVTGRAGQGVVKRRGSHIF